jgi:hypothetical protein
MLIYQHLLNDEPRSSNKTQRAFLRFPAGLMGTNLFPSPLACQKRSKPARLGISELLRLSTKRMLSLTPHLKGSKESCPHTAERYDSIARPFEFQGI